MADLDLFDDFTAGTGGDLSADALPDFTWDMGTAASNFTAINGQPASASTQTISPKDLFNESPMVAPASTAFTNLTSPDINASPFDSYQTSPAFMTEGDFAPSNSDAWFSLFPDSAADAALTADPIQRTISDHSVQTSSSGAGSPAVGTHAHRKSIDTPPSARHSSVSGVKPRRRKGPLPSIDLDPNDKVAYKRARNTLAARDSRQRKLEHVQTLENENAELREELERWKAIAVSYGHAEN